MTRFIDFLANHWVLSGLWFAIAIALLAYLNSRLLKSLSAHQTTLLVNKEDAVVLDVRERKDFEKGHIVDAINIPLAKLSERAVELDKKKDHPIVVVCQYGQQSGEAVKQLQGLGFTKVNKMHGGMSEWQSQSLPVVK